MIYPPNWEDIFNYIILFTLLIFDLFYKIIQMVIIMSSFFIKIIAMITMICDHYGDAIIGNFGILNYIGKISFPLFAFQFVQGYKHTHDFKKYLIRLLIFAIISQVPFILFLSTFTETYLLNIFFTFLLSAIALYGFEKISNYFLKYIFIIFIAIIAHFTKVDYGAFGIILPFIFYFFLYTNKIPEKNNLNKILMCITVIVAITINNIPDIINYPSLFGHFIRKTIFTCIALIPICLYNGKQGPKIKYLFYFFYPVHLLLLWLFA